MLSKADYQEAERRDKAMKADGHERQRCPAFLLLHQGYGSREIAPILLVDEVTISRWAKKDEARGLGGLPNDPKWGGAHGQRELSAEHREALKRLRSDEAMPGTQVGSGGTHKAARHLIAERFQVRYSSPFKVA